MITLLQTACQRASCTSRHTTGQGSWGDIQYSTVGRRVYACSTVCPPSVNVFLWASSNGDTLQLSEWVWLLGNLERPYQAKGEGRQMGTGWEPAGFWLGATIPSVWDCTNLQDITVGMLAELLLWPSHNAWVQHSSSECKDVQFWQTPNSVCLEMTKQNKTKQTTNPNNQKLEKCERATQDKTTL